MHRIAGSKKRKAPGDRQDSPLICTAVRTGCTKHSPRAITKVRQTAASGNHGVLVLRSCCLIALFTEASLLLDYRGVRSILCA